MKVIGILLILVGIVGFVLSGVAFGDIGLSFAYGGVISILCGIGFVAAGKRN